MVTPLYQVGAQVRAHKASSSCYQHPVSLDPWLRFDDCLVPLLHLHLLHRHRQDVTAWMRTRSTAWYTPKLRL